MTDIEFFLHFEKLTNSIIDDIESQDTDFIFDVEFDQNVLTIKRNNEVFVINRQVALHEIWLSSPISGPHHFFYKNNNWITKDENDIFSILSLELNPIKVRRLCE